eukprot:6471786-Lingulodinium_polyedra.AAC.1
MILQPRAIPVRPMPTAITRFDLSSAQPAMLTSAPPVEPLFRPSGPRSHANLALRHEDPLLLL